MNLPKNFSALNAQDRLLRNFESPTEGEEDPIARNASLEILNTLRRKTAQEITYQAFQRYIHQLPEQKLYRILRQHEIAFRNDLLRTTMGKFRMKPGDRVMFTSGVRDDPAVIEILSAVQRFQDFTPENDPHGEHDFGCVTVRGSRFFFKIDYYDESLTAGIDPYEEEPTRVLTIMRSDEY